MPNRCLSSCCVFLLTFTNTDAMRSVYDESDFFPFSWLDISLYHPTPYSTYLSYISPLILIIPLPATTHILVRGFGDVVFSLFQIGTQESDVDGFDASVTLCSSLMRRFSAQVAQIALNRDLLTSMVAMTLRRQVVDTCQQYCDHYGKAPAAIRENDREKKHVTSKLPTISERSRAIID